MNMNIKSITTNANSAAWSEFIRAHPPVSRKRSYITRFGLTDFILRSIDIN